MLFNLFGNSKKQFDEVFCKNIGGLFYAIAAVDREVTNEEIEFLNTAFVRDKETNNLFNKSQLNMVLNEFNRLLENNANANNCFEDFQFYFLDNKTIFNSQVKQIIWKTADGLASSFAFKNKSELILLAKLKNLLLDNL